MNQITYVVVTFDLSNMMAQILIGPNQNLISEYPDNSFENSVPVETQFMIESFKTELDTPKLDTIPCQTVNVRSATMFR